MEQTKENIKKKRVSFSQYQKWCKCPHHYYLDYIMGKRIFDASLNTCFGTAIHYAIQTYIEKLYTVSSVEADALNLYKMFKEKFEEELLKAKTDNPKFSYTDDEYTGFVFDGEDVLNEFSKASNRLKHFPKNKYDFIGTELPIEMEILNNVDFIAFVDLVLREKETGKIKIYDFKTSSNGWNKYQLADPKKIDQVLLYKAFYSKKFNVPLNMIEVEFFILKRKLYENVAYPQSRLQLFTPNSNSRVVAETINNFVGFVSECFTPDGVYNMEGKYPKIPGARKKNCTYCMHKGVNCDAKPDKIEEE